MSIPLPDKLAFFYQLAVLNHEDSDDELTERELQYRKQTKAFFRGPSPKLRPSAQPVITNGSQGVHDTPVRNTGALSARRTISAPTPGSAAGTPQPKIIKATPLLRKATSIARDSAAAHVTAGQSDASFVEDTPLATQIDRPSLLRTTTYPLSASTRSAAEQSPSAAPTMRKRKRDSSTKVVPESEQIFRGSAFYYIPDNDVAPLRKIRIGRAREHGAKWIRSLDGATHVVVDKNLAFNDIETVIAKAVGSCPVIVNEDYPIDCITFKTLLNPDQQRYRVAGCPLPSGPPASSPSNGRHPSQGSDQSLVVKESRPDPKRMTPAPSAGTPPRSEESSLRRDGNGQVNNGSASEVFEEPENISEQEDIVRESPAPVTADKTRAQPQKRQAQLQHKDTANDELTEYISLLQQYKDLPLDDSDSELASTKRTNDNVSPEAASPGSDSGSTSSRARKRRQRGRRNPNPKPGGPKIIAFEERFACHQGGTKDKDTSSVEASPNARTIEVLQSMLDYYTATNDHWRTTAYRKAISTLKRQTYRITNADEAYTLPNIGPRLAAKIEEIATTDRLRRLESAQEDPLTPVLELFLKIYDVGLATARKWISQGHRTLNDLREKVDLTPNQRIGIERYEDLNTRIPRAEVEALAGYVRRGARQLDPTVEFLVGGSYRRGAESSGDIDFIVTKKGTTSAGDLVPFLGDLVAKLTSEGFLVAALAAHRSNTPGGGSKWHGCCVLPTLEGQAALGQNFKPLWRRIDFLLVPETEYGAALIYFTGNDIFNRSIRLLASRKGMRLNQRGLYKEVMRGPSRIKVTEGELVEGRDEKRIFELLGVKWREPRERWC